jgi:hypothetical protein
MSTRTRRGIPAVDDLPSLGAASRLVARRDWESLTGHVTVTAHCDFHSQTVIGAIMGLEGSEDYMARTRNSAFAVEQHLTLSTIRGWRATASVVPSN